jgi:DNA polymerase
MGVIRESHALAKVLRDLGFGEIYLREASVGVRKKIEVEPDRKEFLEALFGSYRDCTKCDLHRSRSQVVFGDGNPLSPIVFVGEAPGEEEDKQGKPFVGRAGQYLNRKIEEVLGLRREEVYITNVCKCRPPSNRKPSPSEIRSCFPYLKRELEILKPKVICCLGATAAEGIIGKNISITKARGKLFSYPFDPTVKVLLTYHPAYILRNPSADSQFTEDLEKLKGFV